MNALATIDQTGDLAAVADTPEFRSSAMYAAEEFAEATTAIKQAMNTVDVQCARIQELFKDGIGYSPFSVSFSYGGSSHLNSESVLKRMKHDAWECIVRRLRVRDIMSIERRAEFDRWLENADLPEITGDTIVSVVLGLAGSAKQYAAEAAREAFDFLRPQRSNLKTNCKWRVGRKVILGYAVERRHGGRFRASYGRSGQRLAVLDNLFHRLDGKATVRDGRPPLIDAIEASEHGFGETEYFRFRCCKNHNLHIEFKREDLVREINLLAAGEAVLGDGSGDD